MSSEGIINTEKKFLKGFSLIEMTVVMAIIAIITVLGAPGLISARKQFIVDATAEELISTIRDVQNRAISIKRDPDAGANETKVWGVKIKKDDNNFYILSENLVGGSISENLKTTGLNPYTVVGLNLATDIYVYFTTPFGKACVANSPETDWAESSNVEKDYIPTSITCNSTDQTINLSYSGVSKSITIKANGDVDAN